MQRKGWLGSKGGLVPRIWRSHCPVSLNVLRSTSRGVTNVLLDTSAKTLIVGQLIFATISSLTAGGRVINLSLDPETLVRSQITEVSTVGSILPGHLVSALVTAVVPSGLNVKICGFFDGTINLVHLGLSGGDIEEKYKVGKKVG